MKQIFAVMCVVVLALFVTGCEIWEEIQAQQENVRAQVPQDLANKVIGNISYLKDTRTSLCFVYSTINGGPTLATVPCEKIPPELLTVAK